jgi:hypothetical protein
MGRLTLLALLLLLAACSGNPSTPTTAPSSPSTAARTAPAVAVSPPPQPSASVTASCPYLADNTFISDTNGEMVGKVKISTDKPHPACFFYNRKGEVQVTVRVYTGQPAAASAVVNEAAPISTSSAASLDGGWTGGSQSTDTGAVYAVSKGGTAVVVTSNQKETIKCKTVVQRVLQNLQLV